MHDLSFRYCKMAFLKLVTESKNSKQPFPDDFLYPKNVHTGAFRM